MADRIEVETMLGGNVLSHDGSNSVTAPELKLLRMKQINLDLTISDPDGVALMRHMRSRWKDCSR